MAIRFNRKVVLFIVGVVVLVLSLLITFYISVWGGIENGADSRDSLVTSYLLALQNSDSEALEKLLPTDYQAQDEIARLIQQYGGNPIQAVSVSFLHPIKLSQGELHIEGEIDQNGERTSVQLKESIQRIGDRWYLVKGVSNKVSPIPVR